MRKERRKKGQLFQNQGVLEGGGGEEEKTHI